MIITWPSLILLSLRLLYLRIWLPLAKNILLLSLYCPNLTYNFSSTTLNVSSSKDSIISFITPSDDWNLTFIRLLFLFSFILTFKSIFNLFSSISLFFFSSSNNVIFSPYSVIFSSFFLLINFKFNIFSSFSLIFLRASIRSFSKILILFLSSLIGITGLILFLDFGFPGIIPDI